jgi:uncharacterized protein
MSNRIADYTIEQKLNALLKLQTIDSKMDEILKIRGDLPEGVQDLGDEIEGYNTRLQNFKTELQNLENYSEENKTRKKEADRLIQKYKEQQNNVKNNREFESLSKEIESEELEIELCDKRIRETQDKINKKTEEVRATTERINDKTKDLDVKKQELNTIIQESEGDEAKLTKDREKQMKNVEDRLLRSYEKIRKNASNGLAVVMVIREACGGCFNIVPPQRQTEIFEKKKIIVCEHCGRIFAGVDEVVVVVPEEKIKPVKAPKKLATTKKDGASEPV